MSPWLIALNVTLILCLLLSCVIVVGCTLWIGWQIKPFIGPLDSLIQILRESNGGVHDTLKSIKGVAEVVTELRGFEQMQVQVGTELVAAIKAQNGNVEALADLLMAEPGQRRRPRPVPFQVPSERSEVDAERQRRAEMREMTEPLTELGKEVGTV